MVDEKALCDEDDLPNEERRLFDKIAEEFLSTENESDFPSILRTRTNNPFYKQLNNIRMENDDCLYSDEELMSVLSIHEQINGDMQDTTDTDEESEDSQRIPSLHHMVMEMSQEIQNTPKQIQSKQREGDNLVSSSISLDEKTKQNIRQIRAIASDVDGTLLTSKQNLHPRTRLAIKRAIDLNEDGDADFFFFPATGKSRRGVIDSLGPEVGSLIENGKVPGVYIQGLYCVDGKGDVIFESKLPSEAIEAAEDLVEEYGLSIAAYDGDNLYTTQQTDIVFNLHEEYGEPLPQLLPPIRTIGRNGRPEGSKLVTHKDKMHKILIMNDEPEILSNTIRPKLESLAAKYGACVTQALPTMLELLPEGCSKGLGVSKVCEALGIDMGKELLAIGDAENDAEMLKLASIGVAVGNGSPVAKDAADFVLEETNDDGGAGCAMEIFGFGSIIM